MTASQPSSPAMTASQWRMALAQLCQDSAEAEPGQEEAMLRLVHALLANLPDASSALGDHLPPAARFEALLAAGAYDSAAFALVPELGSFIVSRAGEGGAMASVMLPGMEEEMTSEAETPALAMISALAAALASCGDAAHKAPAAQTASDMADWDRASWDSADWQRPQGALVH